jgi:hypothetical protein
MGISTRIGVSFKDFFMYLASLQKNQNTYQPVYHHQKKGLQNG